ncbi:ABC transporter ATP-binding protein [Candidatus Enterococcus mangumiae]|uniref:ABC-2 type transport system ATP-binding protein n=1 Tax=Candidatus Enterococcus mangumiae TaxID=2230878 RepID=A0ABZ2T3K7_9ENTE|nr:ATP-binding cassette domain-containing protein [Enterococcus sp. DIV1094]MBO0489879.1 ATP-binding cassette domain-containing protein [Enterococcus sp. DIV1094]
MEKKKIIEIIDLKKRFAEKQVLNGVDFTVERGEVFVLLGSNGAGKTTLVKMLTTILPFDDGQVWINGYDLKKESAKVRENISLTGQFAAVDELLTGYENMKMIAELRHVKEKEKVVENLLERFDLQKHSQVLVKNYSGGMRRRLDIAMSFIGDPQVIFLDEPTTGLDPQNRIATWQLIKETATAGRTIFLTTQYLEEAEYLADKVAILHEGKIILNATPQVIKNTYDSQSMAINVLTKSDFYQLSAHLDHRLLSMDEEKLSVTVNVGNAFNDSVDLLDELRQLPITITNFQQRNASLEDIFLKLVQGGV